MMYSFYSSFFNFLPCELLVLFIKCDYCVVSFTFCSSSKTSFTGNLVERMSRFYYYRNI